jgi:hypothetical protein
MEWRATFWTSEGFIYNLGHLSIPLLQQRCEWFREEKPRSLRSDKSLYLSLTRSPEEIKAAMSFTRHCQEGLRGDDIAKLVKALRRANDKSASDYDPNAPVYNKETCVELHRLVVALLLGHRQALIERRKLAEAEREKSGSKQKKGKGGNAPGPGDTVTAGNVTEVEASLDAKLKAEAKAELVKDRGLINANIWSYSYLLWRVASSQAYRDHLEVIKPMLHKPSEDLKRSYSGWIRNAGSEDEKNKEANGGEKDGNEQEDEAKGPGSQDEEQEDELGQWEDTRSGYESFNQWMGLHFCHFQALHILSLKSENQIETSYLVAKPLCNSEDGPLNWHDAIRKLSACPTAPHYLDISQVTKTIKVLQDFIDSNCSSSERLLPHFGKSSRKQEVTLKPGEVRFIGRCHCEALAAACSKYPDKAAPMDSFLQGKVHFDSIDVYDF